MLKRSRSTWKLTQLINRVILDGSPTVKNSSPYSYPCRKWRGGQLIAIVVLMLIKLMCLWMTSVSYEPKTDFLVTRLGLNYELQFPMIVCISFIWLYCYWTLLLACQTTLLHSVTSTSDTMSVCLAFRWHKFKTWKQVKIG